nr:unnamed protein product [Digitaria exilis]
MRRTYYVPTTWPVFTSLLSSSKILAMPKSEILGFILLSRSTLLALRSLWTTLRHESSWRYSMPRAIPRMMLCLIFQSNCPLFLTSIFSSRSTQQPSSLTRFRCCSLAISSTSFRNSAAPCRDLVDSRFTAISAPPTSTP